MAQEEQEQKQEQKKQELQEHQQEEHELRELGARAARTAGGAGGAAEPSSMRTSETIRRGLHMSMRTGGFTRSLDSRRIHAFPRVTGLGN